MIKGENSSWKKECQHGSSSGYMFDKSSGLGIDYYEGTDGKAYATNIIFDKKNRMRLLRTELVDGKASHFFVETLKKIND